MESQPDALRNLPRIDALLAAAPGLVDRYGRATTAAALRHAVERSREVVKAGGEAASVEALVSTAGDELGVSFPGPPKAVLNATGVIVHTNLGRAPLSDAAGAALLEAAGYCDVEYDLATGRRGSRAAHLQPLLKAATGAEAGIAVNNAAAALVLTLAALATARQVLVSRGELVEIGGSFRLPEIMRAAGVELVEVGTTNRTRASDYEAGDDVALILKVHPSNYRIGGFTEEASVAQLAAVAARRGVPLLHDAGSGLLRSRDEPWFAGEPAIGDSISAGADLVVCSGDKLLGGPQAGLLVGREDLVARCARHPLARALRLDKLRLAALVATLESHVRQRHEDLPVWRALLADGERLAERAKTVAVATGGEVVAGSSLIGGGAAAELPLPSWIVRIECRDPNAAAAALRGGTPPLIVRVVDDALVVDVRTVPEAADEVVVERLVAVLEAPPT
ncbi:MAG: L-seryl-tRNA(Sec) selenium transferase [Nitriliruptorales bacterium]|nr:L-seryl-tRNA(Sec) selenium transferase [Nitriliruptorales bacterium]